MYASRALVDLVKKLTTGRLADRISNSFPHQLFLYSSNMSSLFDISAPTQGVTVKTKTSVRVRK